MTIEKLNKILLEAQKDSINLDQKFVNGLFESLLEIQETKEGLRKISNWGNMFFLKYKEKPEISKSINSRYSTTPNQQLLLTYDPNRKF